VREKQIKIENKINSNRREVTKLSFNEAGLLA